MIQFINYPAESCYSLKKTIYKMNQHTNNTKSSEADIAGEVDEDDLETLIKDGDLPKLKRLLYDGAYVNQIVQELPALSYALECGRYEIAEFLISAGADVCQMDCTGKFSPMFYAIKNKCPIFIINKLISAGFSKDGIVEFECDGTALHLAVYAKYKSAVKYLLGILPEVDSKDANGLTPLHVAVQQNYPKIIKLLMKKGAHVDEECSDKYTPLMYAIHDNRPMLVQSMLDLGSNVNHEPKSPKYSFQKPLNYAAGLGYLKVLQTLLRHKAVDVKSVTATGDSALHSVAFSERISTQFTKWQVQSIVQELLDHGADLECVNEQGLNALHTAIIMKNEVAMKALIRLGSKLTASTSDGSQPLHLAAMLGDAKAVKLLLNYGADPSCKNHEGLTPYDQALFQTDVNTVRIFWAYSHPYDGSVFPTTESEDKQEINDAIQKYFDQQENFLLGIQTGSLIAVNTALQNGAIARGCGSSLMYPLHFAASHSFDIVNSLLERGVSIGKLNDKGEPALHVAAQEGQAETCKLLLSYGACYNYSSAVCAKTPHQVAKERQHEGVLHVLSKVHKAFTSLRRNNGKLTILLDDLYLNSDKWLLQAVLNCIDRRGMTLMSTALAKGNSAMAELIMQYRLKL